MRTVLGVPILRYDETKCDITSKTGTRYVLDVTYSGVPTPQITWKKDGQVIEDSALIENRDSITQLAISKLEMADSGQYSVTAENSVGRDTAAFLLEVKGMQVLLYLLKFMQLCLLWLQKKSLKTI